MDDIRIEGIQEMTREGHNIVYRDKFHNFVERLPLVFVKSFSFNCPVSSTSFMFRVRFQRAPNDGGVDCKLSFVRTDGARIQVDMDFSMSAITMLPDVRLPPRSLRLPYAPPYARTGQFVRAFIPNDILTRLSGSYIIFEANFGIRGCHLMKESFFRRSLPPSVVEGLNLLSKL